LQARLKQCTNGGQRYKQVYVKKKIRPKNKDKRVNYSLENQDKSIDEHWQYLFFTDEAHLDPTSQSKAIYFESKGGD
jgi:hypothetical protein